MRKSSMITSSPNGQLFTLAILVIIHSIVADSMYYADGQLTRLGMPMEIEDDEQYVLITDNELIESGDILKQLVALSKDEIIDMVDKNPKIQQALLKRIRQVVKFIDTNGMKIGLIKDKALDKTAMMRAKLGELKMKLRTKSAVLLRVGRGLKRKIMAIIAKKGRKKKKLRKVLRTNQNYLLEKNPSLTSRRPGIHFSISAPALSR